MWAKRGELDSKLIFLLVELALVAMFIAFAAYTINNAINNQIHYQRYYARDVALLSDALLTSEGDFKLQYEVITSKPADLNFYMDPSSISVLDARQGEESVKVNFLFGKSRIVSAQTSSSVEHEENKFHENDKKYVRIFTLDKEGAKLKISDSLVGDINLAKEVDE